MLLSRWVCDRIMKQIFMIFLPLHTISFDRPPAGNFSCPTAKKHSKGHPRVKSHAGLRHDWEISSSLILLQLILHGNLSWRNKFRQRPGHKINWRNFFYLLTRGYFKFVIKQRPRMTFVFVLIQQWIFLKLNFQSLLFIFEVFLYLLLWAR